MLMSPEIHLSLYLSKWHVQYSEGHAEADEYVLKSVPHSTQKSLSLFLISHQGQ